MITEDVFTKLNFLTNRHNILECYSLASNPTKLSHSSLLDLFVSYEENKVL
jgi:hypothetical protein